MDQASLDIACDREVQFFETAKSTTSIAKQLANSGADSGTLVVAREQSEGRGRLGRSWFSNSEESLTFTLLLRPKLPPAKAALVCLATAVGLAKALRMSIKWPNDLLDDRGRKVSGILAEVELGDDPKTIEWVAVGVGINVSQKKFPAELPNPGSLYMSGETRSRVEILGDVVQGIEKAVDLLELDSDALLDQWRDLSSTIGALVRVGGVEGVAVGIRGDGALLVDNIGEIHVVLAGDVEMVGLS